MTYVHTDEVEATIGDNEIMITLNCEVNCTDKGSPASGPSFSGPGEPAEDPTYEIGDTWLSFNKGIPILIIKDENQLIELFGSEFMSDFYEQAENKAIENAETYPDCDYQDYDD